MEQVFDRLLLVENVSKFCEAIAVRMAGYLKELGDKSVQVNRQTVQRDMWKGKKYKTRNAGLAAEI